MRFLESMLFTILRIIIVPLILFGFFFGIEVIGSYVHRNTGCVIQEEYPEYLDCGDARLLRDNISHVYFVGLEIRGSAKIGVAIEDGSRVVVRAGSRNIDKTLDLLDKEAP